MFKQQQHVLLVGTWGTLRCWNVSVATTGCHIGHPNDSSKILVIIEGVALQFVVSTYHLQIYRDADDQDDLFKASIGAFVSMPILIALIFAIFYSKDSNILMAVVWWVPFTLIAFIFNALTPLGKLCFQFQKLTGSLLILATFLFHLPCICNGETATTFKFLFVVSKAAEQVLESIPQLVINAIYISRTHKEGDSWLTFPILSLVASAVSILLFLIRFPKTYREVNAQSEAFKQNTENETQNTTQN